MRNFFKWIGRFLIAGLIAGLCACLITKKREEQDTDPASDTGGELHRNYVPLNHEPSEEEFGEVEDAE